MPHPTDFDEGFDVVDDVVFDADALDEYTLDASAEAQAGPSAASVQGAHILSGDAVIDLPPISIHVFAQSAGVAAAAEKAAIDRRLSRASLQVRAGGLSAAIDVYQTEPTPSLIIVECLSAPQALLADLDRLAETCDANTQVVVVGLQNDVALYRELIRRGVSEYLVAPIQPLQLIQSISALYANPHTPFLGRTIAFIGARGGVGASTLAHNIAYAIGEQLQSGVVLVDCDLAFGTAGLDFNAEPPQTLADALGEPDRVDSVLLERMMTKLSDRLRLFGAPAALDRDFEIAPEAFNNILQKVRGVAPYVVLDLPNLWSPWVRQTLLAADDVVIVAAPDLASLRNGRNLVELLRRARPNDPPPRVVLNQTGAPGRPEIPEKDFATALGLEPAANIPFDGKLFGAAANNGQMILQDASKAKAIEVVSGFTQRLIGKAPAPQPKSWLNKVLKR